jgi:hypothetical protein
MPSGRQPNPRTRWDGDYRRRLFFARALSSADTVAVSTEPVMRIRPPVASSISTVPGCSDVDVDDGRAAIAGSCAMATTLNAVAVGSLLQSCCRQRKSSLVCIPASAGHLGCDCARLQRRSNDPLLLRPRPAPAPLHRRNHLTSPNAFEAYRQSRPEKPKLDYSNPIGSRPRFFSLKFTIRSQLKNRVRELPELPTMRF